MSTCYVQYIVPCAVHKICIYSEYVEYASIFYILKLVCMCEHTQITTYGYRIESLQKIRLAHRSESFKVLVKKKKKKRGEIISNQFGSRFLSLT